MSVPAPTSRSGKRIYVSVWDLFWALTSPILALYLRDSSLLFRADWGVVGFYCLFAAGFALIGFFAFRIQDGMTRYFSVHEAIDIAEAVLFAELMTCLALFTLTRLDGIPRSTPLIHGSLLIAGLIAARLFVRILHDDDSESPAYLWRRRERIILIGANRISSFFIGLLEACSPRQQRVIAVLDESEAMVGRAISGVRVLGTPQDLDAIISEFAIHGMDTQRVVIAGEADFLSPATLRQVERTCEKRQIELSFMPRILGVTEWQPSSAAIACEPATPENFPPPAFFRLKRGVDIVGALSLIVLFLPVLLAASMLALVDVGRPVLFWQERLGWKGRPFLIYKFRTLRAPFDSTGRPTRGRNRLSAIGRLLRATRIDELPQLLNVLVGDMSLIGPRPLLPEDQPSKMATRLLVRPGISGWAQVNGAKLVTKDEKEKLDEWYIRNASPWLDTRIAIMTVRLLMRMRPWSSEEALADTEQVQSRNALAGAGLALEAGDGRDHAAAA